MDIRYAVRPDQMKLLDTEALRKHFLVEGLFERNKVNMVYSHVDRIIVGGACPADQEVELKVTKELGVDFFLQRREMGIINIGSKGMVSVDGKEHVLESRECLYIGMGSKEVTFKSPDGKSPAKFYFNSAPAHAAYPLMKLSMKDVQHLHLGAPEKSNVRTINQFIHPKVLKTCQLVMGLTVLEPNMANEWAKHNINVNAIAPGYMATDNTAPLRADPVRSKEILERIPAGRWGIPDDLKGIAVFLASEASNYINGYTIAVDGGWLAR